MLNKKLVTTLIAATALFALGGCTATQNEAELLVTGVEPAEAPSSIEPEPEYEPWEYVGVYDILYRTVVRIHDDMPEFVVYHMLDVNAIPSSRFHPFPSPRAITLRIEDETGNIIQTITGLTQSNDFLAFRTLAFADYNFDGYLDMRLMRWQDVASTLVAIEYFWLWDNEIRQFVPSEPLMEIFQVWLNANQETQQIQTMSQAPNGGGVSDFYEWRDGELVLVQSMSFTPAPEEAAQTPSYITIRGEQFSTELTELSLLWLDLTGEDIVPLQYMVNLTELTLRGNQIDDITPLAGLTNLTWLFMQEYRISNITPLAGLVNLEFLGLYHTPVEDLTPLAGLTNLTQLELNNLFAGSPIRDLTPLENLVNLTHLTMPENQISDLSPLAGLANLEHLILTDNEIRDLSPLANLQNLRLLHLWFNPVEDWSPVAHVENVGGRDD